jgi:hypothetical protein
MLSPQAVPMPKQAPPASPRLVVGFRSTTANLFFQEIYGDVLKISSEKQKDIDIIVNFLYFPLTVFSLDGFA